MKIKIPITFDKVLGKSINIKKDSFDKYKLLVIDDKGETWGMTFVELINLVKKELGEKEK